MIDDEADEEAPEVKAWVQQMAALDQEMAQHMGSVPFKDGKPEPGSDLETGRPGRISRSSQTLRRRDKVNPLDRPREKQSRLRLAERREHRAQSH